jgi:hypothetical protein
MKTTREQAAQGSDTYATALAWLGARQDAATGAWLSTSMNKQFPADSMMIHFMTDAATAYAALALLP